MFDLTVTQDGDDSLVSIGDIVIAKCDEQKANFWRCVGNADKVFVSCDVGISFGEDPVSLVVFRITQEEMERFLSQVLYTHDHCEHQNRVGWIEIDPTIQRTLRQGAEDIIESTSMWIDEDPAYPKDMPFILIHPERNTITGEAFIQLMHIYMESDPIETV